MRTYTPRADERPAAGVRVDARTAISSRARFADERLGLGALVRSLGADQVPRRVPRPGAAQRRSRSSTRSASASTGCCSRRRTRSSIRAASRPSCAASASRANVHRVPDYMGVGPGGEAAAHPRDRRDRGVARLHARLRGLRLHGRGRGVHRGDRAGRARLHGPVVARGAQRGRQGRGEEARARARQLGDPGRRRRQRARAAARAAKDRAGARGARARSTGSPFAWDAGATLEENAEALLQAGYAKLVELVDDRRAPGAGRGRVPREIWREYPSHRIRFKHIGGGGGKGQRVVARARAGGAPR